jgi:hypothetical protein
MSTPEVWVNATVSSLMRDAPVYERVDTGCAAEHVACFSEGYAKEAKVVWPGALLALVQPSLA